MIDLDFLSKKYFDLEKEFFFLMDYWLVFCLRNLKWHTYNTRTNKIGQNNKKQKETKKKKTVSKIERGKKLKAFFLFYRNQNLFK